MIAIDPTKPPHRRSRRLSRLSRFELTAIVFVVVVGVGLVLAAVILAAQSWK